MSWACDRFDQYLLGQSRPFIIETDHKPVVVIMNTHDLEQCPPRLQRLKRSMARFYCRVVFVPGKDLLVADTLSRAPVDTDGSGERVQEMDQYVSVVALAGLPVSDVLFEDIRQATLQQKELSALPYLRGSWPSCRKGAKVEARRFWDIRHTLSVEYGVVPRGDQIVIPQALRESMIQKAHEGHLGLVKTTALARQHVVARDEQGFGRRRFALRHLCSVQVPTTQRATDDYDNS